jgi:hypothetical protein
VKHKPTEIPKFDLAEQILAEQRKLSTVRRKAPRKRAKVSTPKTVKPAARPIELSKIPTEQERIVAEIVARDIENLVNGNASSLQD